MITNDLSLSLGDAPAGGTTNAPLFVLVAGEASGDIIGAAIMERLRACHPGVRLVGVGGPRMVAEGLECWYPMSLLSVMGITEVLRHLPELLKLRAQLARRVTALMPTAFIGIDAPDFNLGLAQRVRQAGVRTVHVVSPSVWAWRQGRIKLIEKAVDLMLPLFPFEAQFYDRHHVRAKCIGHPLADEIPLKPVQKNEALEAFLVRNHFASFAATPANNRGGGSSEHDRRMQGSYEKQGWHERKVLAVLPGSRGGELKYIAPVFIQAMAQLAHMLPNMFFLVPCVSESRLAQFTALLPLPGEAPWVSRVQCVLGESRQAMASADAVLVASGTATLEAMLLKKPMVVAYRWHWLTHAIIAPLVKTPFVALPNLLADRALVPELIQKRCHPDAIVQALLPFLSDAPPDVSHREALFHSYSLLHEQIRCDAARAAVQAIAQLCDLGPEASTQAKQGDAVTHSVNVGVR